MLPKRTYATYHNDPVGTKKARERVTINACANQSGTIKLTLLLIGCLGVEIEFIYIYGQFMYTLLNDLNISFNMPFTLMYIFPHHTAA